MIKKIRGIKIELIIISIALFVLGLFLTIFPEPATKKSNELMAHAYSKLYNIPSTGLRFFTVYGPAGRPDMSSPKRA